MNMSIGAGTVIFVNKLVVRAQARVRGNMARLHLNMKKVTRQSAFAGIQACLNEVSPLILVCLESFHD